MAFLKGDLLGNRANVKWGLDFTLAGQTGFDTHSGDDTTWTAGKFEMKFRGDTEAAYMGHLDDTWGGIIMFKPAMANKETGGGSRGSRVLHVEGRPTGAMEIDKGVLRVIMDRTSSYPQTVAGWGGAPDTATAIRLYGRSANTSSYGGYRALQVYARQYAGGQCANLLGADISIDDRGSGGADGYSVGSSAYALLASVRINGVLPSTATCHSLVVEDTSQGTVGPTNYNNSLLHIRTAGGAARASGAVPCAISFEKMASSSGFTALFGCKSTDGGEGLTAYAGTITGSGNCVRFTFNVNGTPYYFIGYATVDH